MCPSFGSVLCHWKRRCFSSSCSSPSWGNEATFASALLFDGEGGFSMDFILYDSIGSPISHPHAQALGLRVARFRVRCLGAPMAVHRWHSCLHLCPWLMVVSSPRSSPGCSSNNVRECWYATSIDAHHHRHQHQHREFCFSRHRLTSALWDVRNL